MRIKRVCIILCLFLLAFPVAPAWAATNVHTLTSSDGEWEETRTQSFAIIYSRDYEELAHGILVLYGNTLEQEYTRYQTIFETELLLPITIRVYPTEAIYYKLNPRAPEIVNAGTHSHIGAREIALIGENIAADLTTWQQEGLNAFRYELAILFGEQISKKKAPPGLLTGIGGYAEDPNILFNSKQSLKSDHSQPTQSWISIWDSAASDQNSLYITEATSIVAYLVDVYGWATFLKFLNNLPTSEGYRQALVTTYGIEFSALEDQWLLYFPIYIKGRWRAHVIYGFDLSVFEQLLKAGAYSDAYEGLQEAITFLEKIEDQEKLKQAQLLLEQAKTGQEAGILVSQSRQALQTGDYEACIRYADLAQQKLDELGDSRRFEELEIYRSWAQEILSLYTQIDKTKNSAYLLGSTRKAVDQLLTIRQRLEALGNQQGKAIVNQALEDINQRRQTQQTSVMIIAALLCFTLLGVRIRLSRQPIPPEAQLK